MKQKTAALLLFTFLFAFISSFSLVNAQVPAPQTSGSGPGVQTRGSGPSTIGIQNPIKANSVGEILTLAVDLALFVGVILAVLAFIFIGFKFVMAQGSDTKLAEAKKWLLYAIIGTAILIGAKLIVAIITNTLIATGVVNERFLK